MTQRRKLGRKLLSFLLTLALVLGLMPGMSLTAYAAVPDKVYYRVYDYSDGKLTYTDNEIAGTGVTEVTNSTTEWANGTYVVTATTTISSRITVTGTVNLIIFDGATLTADKGITVSNSNTLNIYMGNSSNSITGTGTLIAKPYEDYDDDYDFYGASIGGYYTESYEYDDDRTNTDCGIINIHGGTIIAQKGDNNYGGSGISGAQEGTGGTVSIYYSNVTAYGDRFSSAIGGGSYGSGGTVAIYGSNVNAIVYNNPFGYDTSGIGKGFDSGNNGTLTVGKDVAVYALNGEKTPDVDLSGETNVAPEGGGQVTTFNNSMFTRYTGAAPTPKISQEHELLLTTLTFGESSTYSETTSGVVSVTATNVSSYDADFGWLWNSEEGSLSVTAEEGYTITKCVFRQNDKDPITKSAAPFAVSFVNTDPDYLYILCEGSDDMDGLTSVEVYGYAPPTHTAPDKVYYRVYDYSDGKLTYTDNEIASTDVTEVTSSTTDWTDGTYVVTETTTIDGRITVTGTANLIIFDGATLTAKRGITVSNSNTLNIYMGNTSNSIAGTGTLIANPYSEFVGSIETVYSGASIGGIMSEDYDGNLGTANKDCGTINIHGGTIETQATDNYESSGFSGARLGDGGTVNIYYSNVTAYGYEKSSAIGGGSNGNGGNVAIYGSNVNAIVYRNWGGYDTQGIGKGYGGSNGTLTVGKDVAVYVLSEEGTPDIDLSSEINVAPENGGQITTFGNSMFTRYTGPAPTPPHTHSFTYATSGATITATCTAEGCDLPPSTTGGTDHVAKLSLVAPTLTTHGGTGDATATLDGVADFNTATGKTIATTDIKYVGRGSTTYAESSTAPTNAGTYTAKITVEGKTASLNYEISKANAVPATVTANNRTYDGTEKPLVNVTGKATGGTMNYAIGSDATTAPTKGWGTFIPAKTDAGTYYVWYKVKGDENHNDTDANYVEVSIGKRSVTLTSATDSKTYDGNALTDNTVTASGDGFATGEGATYNVTGSQKVVGSSANAFTYTLNSGTKEANYNITKTEGTLTVTSRDAKYQISPQANSDELKYDGQSHEVTGFETDTFTVEGNTYTVSGLTAAGSGTDAGSYTVSVSGTAVVKDSDGNDVSDEFAVTPQTGTLTINKRSVTLTSASDEKEYDGDALTNDEVSVTGDGFVTGEGATYDVTGTRTLVGSSENAFTYTLNEGTTADNYDITPSFGTLTVTNRNTKYEVTLKANSGTEKYDGNEKTVSGYTIDGNAGEGTGESVVTSFTASNGKTYTVTGMSAEVTGTNAGEYAVNVIGTPIVKDADGNDVTAQFAVSSESGKLTIDKRRVTLTSATDTKVYDGKALSNDEITVSEDGFAEGEGATYDVTGSQTLAGESANAFTYSLYEGTIADNYDITTVEGKLTVTKSDSSGEVTAVSGLVYDGKAKALVTAGKTEGGTLMYRLGTDGKWQQDIPEATDAGTYKIYYYIKGDDNHKDDGSEKEPKGSVETTIKKVAQDKPAETFAVAEASDDKTADGKISGFDKTKTYQYSADDGKTWTDVKAGSIEIAVKSGTYQIRYAEDKNHEAGKAASVTVTAKAAPEPVKKDATINLKSVTQKNNKVQVSWTKVNEADGYDVYIHYCGSKAKKAAKTIKGNSTTSASFKKIDGKKINQKKNFHVKVVAYKMVDGKKITLAKTITGHLAGAKSVKYTNPKALKLTKSKFTVKVGKTAKIKAKITLVNKNKKHIPKSHGAKFRYRTSDSSIATVSKSGKIKGIKKGTCTIYVYAINGKMKKVKVTVK